MTDSDWSNSIGSTRDPSLIMHSSRQNPRIGKEWLSRTKGRRFSVPKVPIPPSHFTDGDYKRSLRNDLVGFQLGKKRNSTGVRSMFESRSSHR